MATIVGTRVASITTPQRRAVRAAIDQEFVFAFRLVMFGAASLAAAAAVAGTRFGGKMSARS